MSITLDEKILGIWYVQFDQELDVMIALMRAEKGYEVRGRTRTYLGDVNDPWDEKDRKRWFGGGVPATSDTEAVNHTRGNMITMTAQFSQTFRPKEPPAIFELVRGDKTVEQFGEWLKSMPWAHSAQVH